MAGAVIVVAACVGLYLASRQLMRTDGGTAGVEVFLAPKPETPHPPPPPRTATTPGAVASYAAPQPNADPVLAQMLTCFSTHRREHTECPQPPPPTEFDHFGRIPAGRDFARPEPLDRNTLYSPGEQMTLAPPIPCMTDIGPAMACAHVTPDPPPPSRTAEQICDAGGIGPCRTPPFVPPIRAPHTN